MLFRSVSRRRVIATVFSGVQNRMTSGYLLRDVINKVNGIHFLAKDELFTLGSLYESMLKEMRDAAGDNGEFYTPRAVVRFMVAVLDPRLGETILDPACGTGGFLVETIAHLEKQCQTVQHRRIAAYLDDLQAKVDRLKALQAQTAAELDALLPAILDRAFKGEL